MDFLKNGLFLVYDQIEFSLDKLLIVLSGLDLELNHSELDFIKGQRLGKDNGGKDNGGLGFIKGTGLGEDNGGLGFIKGQAPRLGEDNFDELFTLSISVQLFKTWVHYIGGPIKRFPVVMFVDYRAGFTNPNHKSIVFGVHKRSVNSRILYRLVNGEECFSVPSEDEDEDSSDGTTMRLSDENGCFFPVEDKDTSGGVTMRLSDEKGCSFPDEDKINRTKVSVFCFEAKKHRLVGEYKRVLSDLESFLQFKIDVRILTVSDVTRVLAGSGFPKCMVTIDHQFNK